MQRLITGAVSLVFIAAAATEAYGKAESSLPPPVAPKDIQLKDDLARKDPKKLTKKEKDKLQRKKLMKAESLRNSAEGI